MYSLYLQFTVLLDTSVLPNNLKLYTSLYLEMLFESPILRGEGEVIQLWPRPLGLVCPIAKNLAASCTMWWIKTWLDKSLFKFIYCSECGLHFALNNQLANCDTVDFRCI